LILFKEDMETTSNKMNERMAIPPYAKATGFLCHIIYEKHQNF